ncbi:MULTISPECIES: ABC transporter ATP-binding protein [unclassified Desulfobacter]|jgi:cobalt/nickel transport system ATP-binding protein|uniref:energy-coupling factor ABC transporter ATP-binding protein n=1 Tax=unclassified Desulfobacter TaxID=2634406 RepID=UPI000E9EF1BD|nr:MULTISPECIES: ABC transporter ATP-binding protein [unclassified Desulfobacter]MDQ1269478.1 ABC-type cobalt transport system, ATPase component [Thermodesulfobacteriota bacterium]HBT87519.1 ABC transporter ATP-binding protein [Desulfobacter sp.]
MAESNAFQCDEFLIDLENVSFSYPGQGPLLDRLNFQLRKGERLGLIGPNGSGKSTFMHLLMGLIKPDSGSVRLFGMPMAGEKDFKQARKRLGFVFQNADDQLFSPTVIEDVAFGLLNNGKTPKEAVALSKKILRALDLEGFEDRITYKLSGGEKKLVSLATVLVMEPEVLLLDEPTTGLDEQTVKRIADLLNELNIGYVVVSHEFDFLAKTTGDIFAMKNGQIRFQCTSDQFRPAG